MKKKEEMIVAITKEFILRKSEFENEIVETIYLGGGTPSLLSVSEINFIIDEVYKNYNLVENPEITLEANPDDLSFDKIVALSKTKINRLSIGIQSFFEDDLKTMNRAHNEVEAKECLKNAKQFFDNISIDLIYGIPEMSNEKWKKNIQQALDYGVKHISSYALTVEPKTALKKLIEKGVISEPKDDKAQEHFTILTEVLEKNNFMHYEISNFAKENFFSKNNSSYWLGKKYLGFGPSAHSYNGESRSWNVKNNTIYIQNIQDNILPSETELLSITDCYNEYVMTGLRTIWGVSVEVISNKFGGKYSDYIKNQSKKHLSNNLLSLENNILKTTKKGKFLTDGIASDLFYLNLE